METGRIHRYGMPDGALSEVDLLEKEFAEWLGAAWCLACSSGGYALHIALKAAGIGPGDQVLTNAFTLAPVPGAIHNSGATPVLVESDEDYRIDLDDLAAKAPGTQALMLSHMRGHLADMDRIVAICRRHDLLLIEDCAHTMGAAWDGRASGTFGDIACFSTQTYKHINSGEGGLLVTSSPSVMARAIVLSGSYMLFDSHASRPPIDAFDDIALDTPNYSGRMDNLRAAILRPQLRELDQRCVEWTLRYRAVEAVLATCTDIRLPVRPPQESFVGSSIQFSLPGHEPNDIASFVATCATRGVALKWFGAPQARGYTSRYEHWQYLGEPANLPATDEVLASMIDMRLPLTFTLDDCRIIAEIIVEVASTR